MATNSSEYMKEYYIAHRETIRKQNNEALKRFRERHAEDIIATKKTHAKQKLIDLENRAEEYFNNDTA